MACGARTTASKLLVWGGHSCPLPLTLVSERGQTKSRSGVLPFFVPLSDTTPAAQAIQLEIHRSMTGVQRIRLAYEMSMAGRELNRARLRMEHPEWVEAQIARELLRLAFFPQPLPAGLKLGL